jgi:hypothetical protein
MRQAGVRFAVCCALFLACAWMGSRPANAQTMAITAVSRIDCSWHEPGGMPSQGYQACRIKVQGYGSVPDTNSALTSFYLFVNNTFYECFEKKIERDVTQPKVWWYSGKSQTTGFITGNPYWAQTRGFFRMSDFHVEDRYSAYFMF